jgi:hypothetical protein
MKIKARRKMKRKNNEDKLSESLVSYKLRRNIAKAERE